MIINPAIDPAAGTYDNMLVAVEFVSFIGSAGELIYREILILNTNIRGRHLNIVI